MLVCTAINMYLLKRQTNANKAFKVPVITLQNTCPPKIKKERNLGPMQKKYHASISRKFTSFLCLTVF